MLSWLFKLRGAKAPVPAAAVATKAVATQAAAPTKAEQRQAVQARAETRARQADTAEAQWAPQLQAALGDDSALLRISQDAPALATKLAAVQALQGEAALREAERSFRSHDRRVHRIARQRLDALVAQREARVAADALITTVSTLLATPDVPLNHLVKLDQAWSAIGSGLLDAARSSQFATLRQQLDSAMTQRDTQQQQVQRWRADVAPALAAWPAAIAQVVAQGQAGDAAAAAQPLQGLLAQAPLDSALAAHRAALDAAVQAAAQVDDRLAWLAQADVDAEATTQAQATAQAAARATAQTATASVDTTDATVEPSPVEANTATAADAGADQAPAPASAAPIVAPPSPRAQWQALPALADASLARQLDQRFALWLQARTPAVLAAPAQAPLAAPRAADRAARRPAATPASPAQRQAVQDLLQQAEAAAADGQLVSLQTQLQAIDDALAGAAGLTLPDSLQQRRQALQAERTRLKSWQQWGGGRAREDVVDEAESLARLTLAAAQGTEAGDRDAPKLSIKTHGDTIQALRQRWKDLDRQGAAAAQPLWLRFDAALVTAYQPVAAHLAQLKAARQDNLAARQALLDTLDATPLPGDPAPAPAATADGNAPDTPTPDTTAADTDASPWRRTVRALDQFHTAWRQLGPLEHTVPHAARSALQQRQQASVDRLAQPLQHARQSAEAGRERLIQQAQALAEDSRRQPPPRDISPRLRELQAQWQQQARALPLARPAEVALWDRFKAAGDAVIAQRDAAFSARDAEFAAQRSAGEALLQRLAGLAALHDPAAALHGALHDAPHEALHAALADTAPPSLAEQRRSLAEIDGAWRQLGDWPRGAAAAIEGRYAETRAAALRRLADGQQQHWARAVDALGSRLLQCEQREDGAHNSPPADTPWPALPPLPEAWTGALAARHALGLPLAAVPAGNAFDDLLLQIEAALDLPSAPEWQAARHQRKLLALKSALEARPGTARPASAASKPQGPLQDVATALRHSPTSPAQRARLHSLLAALRQAPPAALGL